MSVAAAPPVAPAWERALRQFGARSFEAAPGAFTWIMLFAPAWIPIVFKLPGAIFVAVVVLIFDAYWVLRAVSVVTGVYSTMLRMRRDMREDWLALCPPPALRARADPLPFPHLFVVPTYTAPPHLLEPAVPAIVDAHHP